MTLEQLRLFVSVAHLGSFTRAAEVHATQKSHASRVVSQLEAELGLKLMERSTRSLSLTEAGRDMLGRAQAILDAVDDAQRMAQQAQGAPRGTLRLTCGVEFGTMAVSGWIAAFLRAHPAVRIEAEYTPRVADLVHEAWDLAIRIGPLEPSRLVARHLGDLHYGLFASPAHLQEAGSPKRPEQLGQHELVVFSPGAQRTQWRLRARRNGEEVLVAATGRLKVNSTFAVRDVLLQHLGIGRLPWLIAKPLVEAGALVPVLPGWSMEPVPVHAVFTGHRHLAPKVRAFIDLAQSQFPSEDGTDVAVRRR